MTRPTFNDFKRKAMKKPGVKREYDTLTATYSLRKRLIEIRLKSGLTQEGLAEILHTKKSNISRLESVNSKISPKLSTIEEYAKAAGYKLKINFVPDKN